MKHLVIYRTSVYEIAKIRKEILEWIYLNIDDIHLVHKACYKEIFINNVRITFVSGSINNIYQFKPGYYNCDFDIEASKYFRSVCGPYKCICTIDGIGKLIKYGTYE